MTDDILITPNNVTFHRPNWTEYYLGLAHAAAARAACTRSMVGAVIVDADNRIASVGYNGAPPGERECLYGGCPRGRQTYDELAAGSDYANCVALHAEVNALAYSDGKARGGTCYVTRQPCDWCAKVLRAFGIVRAVWPGGEVVWRNEG